MDAQDAFETAKEVSREALVDPDSGEPGPEDACTEWLEGEAAAWLADLDYDSDVRRAALRGLVETANELGYGELYKDEADLARSVAEAMNVGL